jgi:excinuclease ABC subunit A
MDGALAVYKGTMELSWRTQQIATVGKKHGFDVFTPIKNFTEQQLQVLLYGDKEPINGNWSNGASMWMRDGWEGVIPQTMRLYRQTESDWRKEDIEKFMTSRPCGTCKGKKLQPVVLAVQILDKSIIDVTDLSIEESVEFFHELPPKLNEKELFIAKQVLKKSTSGWVFLRMLV